MDNILLFDANKKPIKIGSFLAYTEDLNPEERHNYADSLVQITKADFHHLSIKTILLNTSPTAKAVFAPVEIEDDFDIYAYQTKGDGDQLQVFLHDYHLMDNQDSPNAEDLENQLKIIRGIP